MRILKIFFGLFILAAVIFTSWYLLSRNPSLLLVKETGKVYYKLPQTENFQELTSDYLYLPFGTSVKTEVAAKAHVIFMSTNLISLDESAELVIDFTPAKLAFKQTIGNVWYRLHNDYDLEAYTPDLLVTQGNNSEFALSISKSGFSELVVFEGSVVSGTYTSNNAELKLEREQRVEKNNLVRVSKENFQMLAATDQDLQSNWYQRNLLLDQKIKDLTNWETEFYEKIIKNIDFIMSGLKSDQVLGEADNKTQINLLKLVKQKFLSLDWLKIQCSEFNTQEAFSYLQQLQSEKPSLPEVIAALPSVLNYLDLLKESCSDSILVLEERSSLARLQSEAIGSLNQSVFE